ncbi:hypothetical protein [Thermoleptolyngbya sp.]
MAISQRISHVAVYTLVALAAQDVPQAAIAQSLRIDAPPMGIGLATSTARSQMTALVYGTVAPPEVAATGLSEWAESTADLTAESAAPTTWADPMAIAPAPLPQPLTAIAPPEALDRAIAPQATQATQTDPLWQPLVAPSRAIAPPESLFEEPIGLEASTPLFDPWIDAAELSLLDQEWSQLQQQDDLWEWLA